jgi:hypothetical protein
MIIFAVQKYEEYMNNTTIQNDFKILGMISQSPLTHLTKTLTMKKFYVFHQQRYNRFFYYQTF